MTKPSSFHYSNWTRPLRFLQKTKTCPDSGSLCRFGSTCSANPSKPRRIGRHPGLAAERDAGSLPVPGLRRCVLPPPELQTAGWLPRLPPTEVLRFETWDGRPSAAWDDLRRAAQAFKGPGLERERE